MNESNQTPPQYDPPDALTAATRLRHLQADPDLVAPWEGQKPELQQRWRDTVAFATAPYRREIEYLKKELAEVRRISTDANNKMWNEWVAETNAIRAITGDKGNVTPVDAVTKLKSELETLKRGIYHTLGTVEGQSPLQAVIEAHAARNRAEGYVASYKVERDDLQDAMTALKDELAFLRNPTPMPSPEELWWTGYNASVIAATGCAPEPNKTLAPGIAGLALAASIRDTVLAHAPGNETHAARNKAEAEVKLLTGQLAITEASRNEWQTKFIRSENQVDSLTRRYRSLDRRFRGRAKDIEEAFDALLDAGYRYNPKAAVPWKPPVEPDPIEGIMQRAIDRVKDKLIEIVQETVAEVTLAPPGDKAASCRAPKKQT